MLIRIRGDEGGLAEYLREGRKAGRDETRDALDERIILAGDLDEFENIVAGMDSKGDRYLHFTFSFAEHDVSPELLRAVTEEAQRFLSAGFASPDELYVYAEAHMPRIKEAINSETGERFERLPHIHMAVPMTNLVTGTREEVIGLHDLRLKYIDSLQEHINAKFGLKSPKNSPRDKSGKAESIARHSGRGFEEGATVAQKKAQLAQLARESGSRIDFVDALSQFGEVRVRNAGTLDEHLYFKAEGAKRGMNLREGIFRERFLNATPQERLILTEREPDQYRDVGEPHPAAKSVEKTLADWHAFGAKEMRFAGSWGRQKRYGLIGKSDAEKVEILAERERKFYDKHKSIFRELNDGRPEQLDAGRSVDGRGIGGAERGANDTGGRGRDSEHRHPAVGVGAPRPKLPALGDRGADRNDGGPAIRPLPELRQSRDGARRNGPGDDLLPAAVPGHHGSDQPLHGASGRKNGDHGAGAASIFGRLKPQALDAHFAGDNEVCQTGRDLVDRMRQKAAAAEMAEIREGLDPRRLLASLAETHRINPKLYAIDGQKIICGRRSLSVNDFMTREMHLRWPAAEPILRATWAAQQRGEPFRPAEKVRALEVEFLEAFKGWREQHVSAAKIAREAIKTAKDSAAAADARKALDDVLGALRDRREPTGSTKRKRADEAANLSVARMEQAFDMRAYLVERAEQHQDAAALAKLRRLGAEHPGRPGMPGNRATGEHARETEFLPGTRSIEGLDARGISYTVDRDGSVDYWHAERGHLVRDEAHAIVSRREERDVVGLQLQMAVSKFGDAPLRLTGTASFVALTLDVAASQPRAYKFEDERLQARYEALRLQNVAVAAKERERIDLAGVQATDEAAEQLLAQAFDKASVATERDLYSLLRGMSHEQQSRIMRAARPDLIEVGQDDYGRSLYTTAAVVAREIQLIDDARALSAGTAHSLTDAQVERAIASKEAETAARIGKPVSMSDEQKAAVRHSLQAGDLAILQGSAGAGKSFAMEAVRLGYEQAGYQVLGCAIARRAAQNLEDEAGIKSSTIAKLLSDLDKGKVTLNERSAIIVDEAGQVGAGDMARLLAHTHKAGAKILLTGEDRQLDAIQHGGVLRRLSEPDMVGTARIMTIQRQREEWARQAVADLRDGKAEAGFSAFEKAGCVEYVAGGASAVHERMVELWEEGRRADPKNAPLLLAHKNVDVRALSEHVRRVHQVEGRVTGPEHKIEATGSGHDYKLALAKGDRIRFCQNDEKGVGVINGTLGSIESIKPIDGGKDFALRVATDDRGTVNFKLSDYKAENGRAPLSHAYAMTIYASQGVTTKNVVMQQSASMDRAATYVGASRFKSGMKIVVDKGEFAQRAERSGTDVRSAVVSAIGRDRGRELAVEAMERSMRKDAGAGTKAGQKAAGQEQSGAQPQSPATAAQSTPAVSPSAAFAKLRSTPPDLPRGDDTVMPAPPVAKPLNERTARAKAAHERELAEQQRPAASDVRRLPSSDKGAAKRAVEALGGQWPEVDRRQVQQPFEGPDKRLNRESSREAENSAERRKTVSERAEKSTKKQQDAPKKPSKDVKIEAPKPAPKPAPTPTPKKGGPSV